MTAYRPRTRLDRRVLSNTESQSVSARTREGRAPFVHAYQACGSRALRAAISLTEKFPPATTTGTISRRPRVTFAIVVVQPYPPMTPQAETSPRGPSPDTCQSANSWGCVATSCTNTTDVTTSTPSKVAKSNRAERGRPCWGATGTGLHQEEAWARLVWFLCRQRDIRGNCHLMTPVQKTTAITPNLYTLLTAAE